MMQLAASSTSKPSPNSHVAVVPDRAIPEQLLDVRDEPERREEHEAASRARAVPSDAAPSPTGLARRVARVHVDERDVRDAVDEHVRDRERVVASWSTTMPTYQHAAVVTTTRSLPRAAPRRHDRSDRHDVRGEQRDVERRPATSRDPRGQREPTKSPVAESTRSAAADACASRAAARASRRRSRAVDRQRPSVALAVARAR